MAPRAVTLGLALVALLAPTCMARVPSALQIGGPMDACDTCKLAVRVLSDALCDEYVDDSMARWVVDNVCPQTPDKEQCAELVVGLAPVVVQWLRASATPEAMCSDAGVCQAAALEAPTPQPPRLVAHASQSNDATCPLCTFVVGTVKAELSDPVTQQEIRDKSLRACSTLPAGTLRDACVQFVQEYEAAIFNYINTMEPEEVCAMLGTCLGARLAAAPLAAPLSPQAVSALGGLVRLVTAPPSNDRCDTCKVVIMELHQVVANPNVQSQIVDYAKQACGLIQSLSAQCVADVDQYAPMVFGMALAYLQPEQVCVQLNLCPAPSSAARPAALAQAALAVQSLLLRGKAQQYAALEASAAPQAA